uniref:Uncharacterized protein n=1 Tax=Fagus sylvatica TaxID=28930 RepID=A0A2N9ELR4_FAGSY
MAKFSSNSDPCSHAIQIIEAFPASQRLTDTLIPCGNALTSSSSASTSPRCGLGPSFSSYPEDLSPIFPYNSHFAFIYQNRQMNWREWDTFTPLLSRGTSWLPVGIPGLFGRQRLRKDSLRPAVTWSASQDLYARGSLQLRRATSGSSRAPPVKAGNLNQKMTPWHKEHSNGLRSQDHILRTQARLCARPVPLENRVFLTRNKLICKPGHVGKRTHSCTTWNSRIAKNLPGLAGIRSEKCPPTDQKHPVASVRGTISHKPKLGFPQIRNLAKLGSVSFPNTKNVKIRHRELGQICA